MGIKEEKQALIPLSGNDSANCINMDAELGIQEETEILDTSSEDTAIVEKPKSFPNGATCSFCGKEFAWRKNKTAIDRRHIFYCKVTRHLEPERSCQHCGLRQPISKSCLHEIMCINNPDKKLTNKKGSFKCCQCDQVFSTYDTLKTHLTHCVTALGEIIAKMRHSVKGFRKRPGKSVLTISSVKKKRQRLDSDNDTDEEYNPYKKTRKKARKSNGPVNVVTPTASGRSKLLKRCCPFCNDGIEHAHIHGHLMVCQPLRDRQPRRQCSVCKKFGAKSFMYLHESRCLAKKIKPSSERTYKCTICSNHFSSDQGLAYHLSKECLKSYLDDLLENGPDSDQSELLIDSVGSFHVKNMGDESENGEEEFVILESGANSADESNNKMMSASGNVSCPFCPEEFPSIDDLKTKHPLACNGIKMFEPKKKCSHCDLLLPTSICGLHMLVCKKNTYRIPLTTTNLQHSEIFCPECKVVGKAQWMPEHLATCYKHIKPIIENALVNSSLDWRSSEQTDYITKAGLAYWLLKNNRE